MKKNIFLVLAILCFASLSGCSNTDSKQGITLIEAYQISEEDALGWSSDAELVHITSVDDPKIKDDGDAGERLTWTATFHSLTLSKSIILSIKSNKISTMAIASEKIDKEQLIKKRASTLNSDSALEYAKKKYNLQLGTQWAQGYNYTLYRQDEKTYLCVYGEDSNGYFSKISFDFNTGNCLFAEHQIPTGGALWNNRTTLINDVWITGADFSPDYIIDSTLAVQCIENPMTSKSSNKIKVSTDNGLTWVNYLFDDQIMEVKFSKYYNTNRVLYIITINNCYKLVDGQLHNVKNFTEVIDADIKDDKITILTKENLYISDDMGITWSETVVPDGDILDVKIGVEDTVLLRTYPNNILRLKNKTWENINQPLSSLIDYDSMNDKIIGYMDNKIAIYEFSNSEWTVLESPIIIKLICYAQDDIYIIGSDTIYTLSLDQNNFQKNKAAIPPFSIEDIYAYFYKNENNFFIEECGYRWENLNIKKDY